MSDKRYRKKLLFPRWAVGKILLLLLAAVIVAQIVLIALYSQKSTSAQFKVNRDVIARQVINLIQTVENTPVAEQATMISALNIPNFTVTLDDKPKWQPQFSHKSLWYILWHISEQAPNIQLSFSLNQTQWLNIFAQITPPSSRFAIILLVIEIAIMVIILFSLWTINRYTAPLKNLTEAAERLGVDLHNDPLPIDGPAAVRAMAHAMNKMQQRITDLLTARTQMLAAISHDLRTPITRLKLRTQYVEEEKLQQKFISDLDQMEAMLAESLAFVREDGRKEQPVIFDFASLLDSICQDFSSVGHQVEYIGSFERATFTGGVVGLKRVFNNLIENAVKYAGNANVSLARDKDHFIVTIIDDGPGIPPDQLEKVFLPFYRGDNSRSRQTGGTGLGLAVAKDIIRIHGGHISLTCPENGGLQVTVFLSIK